MSISTLTNDIYKLLEEGKVISDADADAFGKRIADMLKNRLQPRVKDRPFTLRMSSIGKSELQLWYEAHGYTKEEMQPHTLLKFLYGDVIEELLLFLCEQSGHSVTDKQKEVNINGIKGHMDCKIDGYTVDVKSTSNRSFDKFKNNTLLTDDPFGYVTQLGGYLHAENEDRGFFLAMNKETGRICLTPLDKKDAGDIPARIDYLKLTIAKDEPPSNVFCMDVKKEDNGNVTLKAKCSYCPFKFACHKGLRTFLYQVGGVPTPKYFTEVVKVPPRVPEITANRLEEELSDE